MRSTNTIRAASMAACAMLLLGCAQQQPDAGRQRFRSGAEMPPTTVRSAHVGEHDRPARRVRGDAPITPVSAAIHGTAGFACLAMVIDVQGHVKDVTVIEATAPIFGVHAAHAVKEWLFEPAERDGKPVAVLVSQSFWFNASQDPDMQKMRCPIDPPDPAAAGTPASPPPSDSSAHG